MTTNLRSFGSTISGAGGRVQRLPAPHHNPRDWRSRGSWLSRSLIGIGAIARACSRLGWSGTSPSAGHALTWPAWSAVRRCRRWLDGTRSIARSCVVVVVAALRTRPLIGRRTTRARANDSGRSRTSAAGWRGSQPRRSRDRVGNAPRYSRPRWIRARSARGSAAPVQWRFAIAIVKMPDAGASQRNAGSNGCHRERVRRAASCLPPAASRAAGVRSDVSCAIGRSAIRTSPGRAGSCGARKCDESPTSTSARAWSSSAITGRAKSVTDRRRKTSSRRCRARDPRSITSCHSRRADHIFTRTCSAPVSAVILEKGRGF
jgi:hypothetical protein